MKKLFRQISTKERLPEKQGTYITGDDEGYVTQNKLTAHDNKLEFDDEGATWWFEEIELPTDDEIAKESIKEVMEDAMNERMEKAFMFTIGAKRMRDFVLAVSPFSEKKYCR